MSSRQRAKVQDILLQADILAATPAKVLIHLRKASRNLRTARAGHPVIRLAQAIPLTLVTLPEVVRRVIPQEDIPREAPATLRSLLPVILREATPAIPRNLATPLDRVIRRAPVILQDRAVILQDRVVILAARILPRIPEDTRRAPVTPAVLRPTKKALGGSMLTR